MGISAANLLVILLIVLIVFGAGKLPKVMGDLGRGLKNFKDGMNEKDAPQDVKEPEHLSLTNTEDKKNDNRKE